MGIFDWVKKVIGLTKSSSKEAVTPSIQYSVEEIKNNLKKANTRVVEYLVFARRSLVFARKNTDDFTQINYASLGIKGVRDTVVLLSRQKNIVPALKEEIFSLVKIYDALLKHMELFLKKKETAAKLIDELDGEIGYLKNRISLLESRYFHLEPQDNVVALRAEGGLVWEAGDTYEKKTTAAAFNLYRSTLSRLQYKMVISIVHIIQHICNHDNNLKADEKAKLLLQERRMDSFVQEFYRTVEMVKGKFPELDKEIAKETPFFTESLNIVKAGVNGVVTVRHVRETLRIMLQHFTLALPKEQINAIFGKDPLTERGVLAAK